MRNRRPVLWDAGGYQLGYGSRATPLGPLTESELQSVLLGVRIFSASPERDVTTERWASLEAALDASRPVPFPPFPYRPVPSDTHPLTRELCLLLEPMAAADAPQLTVLTDHYVTDPLRMLPLLREDQPFLPVVIDDDGASIGPLVLPGVSACPRCLELTRTAADPRWPGLAAQLSVEEPPSADPMLVRLAAAAGAAGIASAPMKGWRVEHGAIATFEVAPHPECGCVEP